MWYLTQWVSFYQLLVGFAFAPALMLPGFASQKGIPWSNITSNFVGGFECFTQQDEACADMGAFWLLTGYCGVNVLYNTLGLYLTKVRAAGTAGAAAGAGGGGTMRRMRMRGMRVRARRGWGSCR